MHVICDNSRDKRCAECRSMTFQNCKKDGERHTDGKNRRIKLIHIVSCITIYNIVSYTKIVLIIKYEIGATVSDCYNIIYRYM